MAANSFKIDGLEGLKDQLKNLIPELKEEIGFEIEASAQTIVRDAKRLAPVDQGQLIQGISYTKIDDTNYEVVSSAPWSAFIEFGTKLKVRIPAGYEEFAAQFKGQKGSGSLDEFFASILDWVRSKGLSGTYSVKTQKRTGKANLRDSEDYDTAYAIFLSILKKGINPHPFLIPAIEAEKPKLLERIKKIVTGK